MTNTPPPSALGVHLRVCETAAEEAGRSGMKGEAEGRGTDGKTWSDRREAEREPESGEKPEALINHCDLILILIPLSVCV